MENDCEIYVDPEEDEVFFGCISEKEKSLCAKLEVIVKDDYENKAVESLELNVDEKNNKNILMNDQSGIVHKEIISDFSESITINQWDNSVEMEHNYSTPMKPKIDKNILTTPKSIVKADKDGGFLKVLSEIALVKAEAEGDKAISKREEDKENRIIQEIPEIRVTEATPEKTVLSPPIIIMNKQTHPFRIIYRSPNKDKFDQKSHSDSEKDIKNGFHKILTNKRKSFDLIDLDDFDILNDNIKKGSVQENDKRFEGDKECDFFKFKDSEKSICEKAKDVQIIIPDLESPSKIETTVPKPAGLRFSKEARKIVEVLKKSAVDDSLNFRIPEADVENETSFVLPEPSDFDKTEFLLEKVEKPESKLNKFLSKTVEKDFHKVSPILPQKHVSERRVYQQVDIGNGIKRCVKKLPLEEHRSISVEKVKDLAPSSKIPLLGGKNTKIPLRNRLPKPVSAKMTNAKTPTTKTIPKNSKFNHIASPINAYIHNKPTALVVNVKAEQKKNPTTEIPVLQTVGSVKKATQTKSQTRAIPAPEKSSKLQSFNTIRLPFVEYKSASPYKIDKMPESRLPRLAPSVQKLIGTQTPRVLKHEGRFYLTTPRKANAAENSTIIADPNEVSVVVCQSAQKSNTIE